jgi:hypothetical protein
MVKNAYQVVNQLNTLDRKLAELQVRMDDLKTQRLMIIHDAKNRVLPELLHEQGMVNRLVSRIQEEC